MADSDDEYDRKRRDKFRGERSAGESYRSERRDERRRDDWQDRNPFRGRARPDYRDYRGARDRYSPGREMPPPKRMRPDWGDEARPRYGGHDGYGMYGWGHEHYPMHGAHGFGGHAPVSAHPREATANTELQTQPPMLTLKQFLDTQDDGISDSEVLRKYSEYKLDFKRQQLNEFFVAHKDEEWFKNKYHPEESLKRKDEQLTFLKKRVETFAELLEQGLITGVTVDTNQTDPLLRLLDTVVIKLEGGTDDDLKVLDEKPPPPIEFKPFESRFPDARRNDKDQDDDVIITEVKQNKGSADEENWDCVANPSKPNKAANDDEENWDSFEVAPKKKLMADDGDDWDSFNTNSSNKKTTANKDNKNSSNEDNWDTFEVPQKKKLMENDDDDWDADEPAPATRREESEGRKRSDSESSRSSSGSSKHSNKENNAEREGRIEPEDDAESKSVNENSVPAEEFNESSESKEPEDDTRKSEEPKVEEERHNTTEEQDRKEEKDDEQKDDAEVKSIKVEESEEMTKESEEDKTETIDLDKEKDPDTIEGNGPRALHRTSSIFLRNLAPTITKTEIELVCKRYNGFLRVAIADPLVERRWFRRGWVTFKRDVNIKEICWNLNNIRLRDCEMGAIVNRDLSRRVRPVNGITSHKTIVRSDIKLCAKIALNLDEKFGLWLSEQHALKVSNGQSGTTSFGFKSNNPVLQNITDYLIEEASAEEEELLGLTTGENKDSSEGEVLDRDPALISVLDKLILYMRIVHSVDFYNHCEYPYEDEMPNRCGIIHARGPPPQNKITNNDIQDYLKNFEGKMASFLAKSNPIEEDELKNLGCKDPEAEVEKFILANTQELAKDKWLCPLSGKKFKGPEFIRKHIFNKHGEKVDEVRKEVEYFNNYLKDPKRPQLPEHPGNNRRHPQPEAPPPMPYRAGYPAPGYGPPYAAYAPPMIAPPRPRGFGNRREMPTDHQRRIIGYHDLDAPQNFDAFD